MKRQHWKKAAAYVLLAAMLSGNIQGAMSIRSFASEDEQAVESVDESTGVAAEESAPAEQPSEQVQEIVQENTQEVADQSQKTADDVTPTGDPDKDPIEGVEIDIVDGQNPEENLLNKDEVKEEDLLNKEEIIEIEEGEVPLADLPMPAFSASGETSDLYVSAAASEGTFPEGTVMIVKPASTAQVKALADKVTDYQVQDAVAADISFYYNETEIQPANGNTVDVQLTSKRRLAGTEHNAVHVDGGSADIVGGASANGASIAAGSFSVYGIVGGNYDTSSGVTEEVRNVYVFKVNGQKVDSQIVKNGDMLTKPADPQVASGKFKGWQVEGQTAMLDFTQTVSVADKKEEDMKPITVNAVLVKTAHATFWKDNGKTEVLQVKEIEENGSVITTDVTWKFADGTGITGWKLNGTEVTSVSYTDAPSGRIDLLPVISGAQVAEVKFETGEGTPVAPVFVETGKTLAQPADPTRSGYVFKGWYTEEACENGYDFATQVTGSFTLYAKWEGQATTYKVVHWKQNANDDGYTFAEMETKNGNAGLNASYTAKNYQGFALNATKSNETVIIKGDGTAIKNVYYDRKMYPLTFYVYEVVGQYWLFGWHDEYDWVEKSTKKFRYEADTSAFWNQVSAQYSGYKWYVGKNSDKAYQAAPVMEPAGGGSLSGFSGISVYGRKSSGRSIIYYLDYDNKTKQVRSPYNNPSQGWSHTEEDFIQIPGWTFKEVGKGYPKNENGIYTSKLYYTRNSYGVKFIPGNGDASIEKSGVKYEDGIASYVPSEYNASITWNDNGIIKTFAGWYDNEACLGTPVDFSTKKMPALQVGGSLVFYGKWTAGEHSVSFDLDGGKFDGADAIATQNIESGKEATAPDSGKMTKDGFVFGGWQDESGNRFSFDTKITRDIQLTAIWNSDKSEMLTIAYDLKDGTGTIEDKSSYQDGSYAVIAGQPTAPAGKYFQGWKVGKSNVILASGVFAVKLEDANNKVVTLTAQYEDLPKHTTSVTYVLNGGNVNGSTDNIVENNAVINGDYKIISTEPKREGFKFLGWSTDANSTDYMFKAGDVVAAGKEGNILYAVWEQNNDVVYFYLLNPGEPIPNTDQAPKHLFYPNENQPGGPNGYHDWEGTAKPHPQNSIVVTTGNGVADYIISAPRNKINAYLSGTGKTYGDIFWYSYKKATNETNWHIDGILKGQELLIKAPKLTKTYNGAEQAAQMSDVAGYTDKGIKVQTPVGDVYVTGLTMTGGGKNVGEYGITWSGTAVVKDTDGTDLTALFSVNTEDGSLKIEPAPLTIETGSANKEYDGKPLTKDEANITGLVNNETATVTATGSQTDVGSSSNTYSIDWGTTNKNNYTVTETLGTLEVTANTTTVVTLTAASDSKTYDGTALTNATVNATGLPTGFTVEASASGSQTDAGESANVVNDGYVIKNAAGEDKTANFTKVTKVEGKLTVNKAPVTITTGSANKEYDGTALTKDEASITGLVNNETATVTATGSQTEVGSSSNTYSIDWGTTNKNNYNVTENLGTLEVTANTTTVVTLTAASDSKTYDGSALTNSGVTAAGLPDGFTVDATASGSQTDAGESANVVNDGYVIKDAAGKDKTANFTKVTKVDGKLTVNKAEVTITTGSASKVYDGTALTNATADISGLVSGETATVTATGSQTGVGSSENTYSIDWGNTNKDNYTITENLGTLTVTAPGPGPGPGPDPDPDPTPTPTPTPTDNPDVLGARRNLPGVTEELPEVLGARRGISTGDSSILVFWILVFMAAIVMIAERFRKIHEMKGGRRR